MMRPGKGPAGGPSPVSSLGLVSDRKYTPRIEYCGLAEDSMGILCLSPWGDSDESRAQM